MPPIKRANAGSLKSTTPRTRKNGIVKIWSINTATKFNELKRYLVDAKMSGMCKLTVRIRTGRSATPISGVFESAPVTRRMIRFSVSHGLPSLYAKVPPDDSLPNGIAFLKWDATNNSLVLRDQVSMRLFETFASVRTESFRE